MSNDNSSLAVLLDAVKDYAIMMLDAKGFVVSYNEGACRVLGYSGEEIQGRHFSSFYPEEDRTSGKPETELFIATTRGRFEEESWRVRGDGGKFFANVIVSPLVATDGSVYGFAKVTRDVTERKESEIRIQELYSVIAHELRSPMTSIKGALGLLEGGLGGQLNKDGREITTNARMCCDRLIRLVNDLLDLSKLSSGKFALNKRLVEPAYLVDESVKNIRFIEAASVRRLVAHSIGTGFVPVDSDRMVQVLTNLIANALKFSPDNSLVTIISDVKLNSVRFEVSNQGSFIPGSARDKVFQKFQQLDQSDSRPKEGSGLGLAISKAIVEEHGGSIDFISDVENGTTFFFEVPTC